jgi:hypothetical protein
LKRSSIWPALAFVALLATPACGRSGAVLFVGTVSRSQFFEYHDRDDEPLCPTLLSMLDQHATQIGGKIGFVPDPANPIGYYKFHDFADFEQSSGCPNTGGCATAGGVLSPLFFEAHELAHTYVFRAWGHSATGLIMEGEAVALSCRPGYYFDLSFRPRDVLRNPNWRDLLYLTGTSDEGYLAAGFWITYLAQHYGWDSVRRLHQRAMPGIAAEDFERAFAAVYPLSMDDAWSAALDTPGALPCQDDWRCMTTPLAVGDRATSECDGEMHRSITVTDQPGIAATIDGTASDVYLRDCANPAAPIRELFVSLTERTAHFAALSPGTYMISTPGARTDLEFSAFLPAGFDAADCSTAGGIALDPAHGTYVDLLPGRAHGWIPIAGGGRSYGIQTYNLYWNGWPKPSGDVQICDGCDATATCVPLPGVQSGAVPIGDGAVLRLQGATALAQSSFGYGQIYFTPGTPASPGP